MYDNNTRPQERSRGFLTEYGRQKLDSFIGVFLTERGKEVFYSLGSRRSKRIFLGWLMILTSLFIFLSFGLVIIEDQNFSTQIPGNLNAIGGADDDQPGSIKHFETIPPDVYPGKWVQPLPGELYITQGMHGRRSDAVDLYAEIGTPVLASRAGRIILSETGYNNGHGNYIIIDHGDGVESVYCHLSVLYVEYGQVVAQGQTIGLSGNTGRVYSSHGGNGAHLHFAVRGRGAKNPLF